MAILIGVDEAGYGPNYGPLCVAASAWSVDPQAARGRQHDEVEAQASPAVVRQRAGSSPSPAARAGSSLLSGSAPLSGSAARAGSPLLAKRRAAERDGTPDLYKLLKKCVARAPDKAGRKLAIADSKALYSPQTGVRQLERGVLAALVALEHRRAPSPSDRGCVRRVADLLAAMFCDPHGRRHEQPCHSGDELELPFESLAEEICRLGARLTAVGGQSGARLVALRARLVYPAEFNDLCDQWGSKGAALSHVTLQLVREVVDSLPARDGASPTHIYLDKHGGRSRYAALVQHHFSECWIDVLFEGRVESRYAWQHGDQPMEAAFRVRCESMLPTALASMTAKYLREVSMRSFNAFWAGHVPGLRPTAGYPKDSQRFRRDIAAKQAEFGLADRVLWRSR